MAGMEVALPTAPAAQPTGNLGVSPVDARHAESFIQAMSITGLTREASIHLMRRFQVDSCLRAMQLQRQIAAQKRRMMGGQPGATRSEQYSVRDMLTFQQDPLATSLLRLPNNQLEPAKLFFQEVLNFMGLENGRILNKEDERLLVSRVLALLGVHPGLRDEACLQLQKQTRNNPYRAACGKAWELFRYCVTVFPPSADVAAPLTQYFELLVSDERGVEQEIRDLVLATWTGLDHAVKIGPRRIVPSSDEVGALINRKALFVPVFLCDESPENIPYDISTSTAEARQLVLRKINVEDDGSFGLYTLRVTKNAGATPGEPFVDHILTPENAYMGDVLADYVKQSRTGYVTSKLLLKRRFFRPSDSATTNRMFLQLCYVQLKADYTAGYYLVTEEGAIMLSALQILAEIGNIPDPETSLEWQIQMKKSIPKVMWRYKSKEDWSAVVLDKYRSLWALDYEATMREFVHIILGLPSGGGSFFLLKTVSDSAEFFPNHVIVGINRNGLHFLDSEVRSVIHAVELAEISEYAGRNDRVFFSMQLRGALHTFEFGTTSGDEICLLMDHFIGSTLQGQS